MWKIPLFDLDFGKEEEDAVVEVVKSKWLTSGPKTKEFEEKFASFLGEDIKCCALANGTAALHCALAASGVGPGDEVIIPALTFVADLNVVAMTGAKPVLADIKSYDNWNISPIDVERKITESTKAVIAVHYAGWPCDMDELEFICKKNNLILIEDAAHAPGGEYKGKKCGTFGDFGCFSFFSNKNLSTGEGGMLSSKNSDLINKAALFKSHGMTRSTMDRYMGKGLTYDVAMPGLNYRIDELKSALGIVQLSKLNTNNQKRLELVSHYIKSLNELTEIIIPWRDFPDDRKSTGHIFTIMLPENSNREEFMNFLKDKGIQTSIHYPGFHEFSFYGEAFSFPCKKAAEVSSRMVTLPLYPGMKFDDIDYISFCIKEYFQDK